MDINRFVQQLEALQRRLDQLYQCVKASNGKFSLPSSTFKELGIASEILQVAREKLFLQADQLATMVVKLEAEQQRYQELFQFLPNGCLETDINGKIIEINKVAAKLLNVSQSCLIGQPIDIFFAESDLCKFQNKLIQIQQRNIQHKWITQIHPRQGIPVNVTWMVTSNQCLNNQPIRFRWIIQSISDRKPMLKRDNPNDINLYPDYPRSIYYKSETIDLSSQTIWLVSDGLIKLSTLNESGNEVIVGLVGKSMAFGSSLTSLPIYDATVLSERAELISVSLTELAASPQISQMLLPRITQRIQQTEFLLAITGRRQIIDRLYGFLYWLKEEFGQPTPEGTRLSIRLTHQDFANICCTTRVTITRLFSKLQQQGKITFDAHRHLVFRE